MDVFFDLGGEFVCWCEDQCVYCVFCVMVFGVECVQVLQDWQCEVGGFVGVGLCVGEQVVVVEDGWDCLLLDWGW